MGYVDEHLYQTFPLTREALQKWERKRKHTTLAFALQSGLLGMDYSLTFLTLWSYLEQMNVINSKQFYSIVSLSYLLVPVLFSVFICRIVDRHRNVRFMFAVGNLAMVTGNLLYSVSLSPWFLVCGKAVAGIAIPLRSVMAGELARCYHHEELTTMFSLIGISFGFGFVAGPGLNFAFGTLDVWIVGRWHVTSANVTGIYMAVLFLFAQLMCHFMVHNLSKEHDLKANVQKENKHKFREHVQSSASSMIGNSLNFTLRLNNEAPKFPTVAEEADEQEEKEKKFTGSSDLEYSGECYGDSIDGTSLSMVVSESTALLSPTKLPNLSTVFRKMITTPDTLIMLVLAFFENFFTISFNMWLPMAVITTLNWPMYILNSIVLGTGAFSLIPCLLLILKKFTDQQLYWASIVSIAFLACLTLVFMMLAFNATNLALNICLWIVFCVCYSNIMILKDIFLGGFLAKMLSSKVQASGDSLRLSCQRVGAMIALLLSPLLYDYIKIVGFVYIGIVLMLLILMILRRNTLGSPTVIIDF